MAVLCLFSSAYAQSKKKVLVNPLQVGQRIPEMILDQIHNHPTTRSDLGDMVLGFMIIELWSTKSESCAANYGRIEDLACSNEYDVRGIRITPESQSEVLSYLLRHPPKVPSWIPLITDDKVLSRLFPNTKAPQYVWLDRTGKIVAMTGPEEVTEENIDLAFNQRPISKSAITAALSTNVQ
ncbi:MAG: hypothetical protein ABWY16_18600 [Pedobacter sp.]|uniref:TlpA family protein disulfide reductase n=1 Tax=Pedobacter sp. TaxID=1411316 RepID=UPI00339AC6FD